MDTKLELKGQKQVAIKLHGSLTNSEYDNSIEREWCRQGLCHPPNQCNAQRSFGFGIIAVSKCVQGVPGCASKFQEVAAFFQVDKEIVLHTKLDSVDPQHVCLLAQEQPFDKSTSDMYIPHNRQTHLGHYIYFPKKSSKLISVQFAPK